MHLTAVRTAFFAWYTQINPVLALMIVLSGGLLTAELLTDGYRGDDWLHTHCRSRVRFM